MASSSLVDFSNFIFTPLNPTTTTPRPLLPHDFPPRLPLCRAANINRRQLIAETAAAIALPPLLGLSLSPLPAKANEAPLSEWERVFLPIDPGVVLLDIAFVPDDPNHGFLLGTRQTILETKDGGTTWVPRSIASAEEEDFNYRFNSISFKGKEGWIIGKPAILLHTSDAGETWERIPLSSQLPGDMVYIKATGEQSAEMVTDEGAIYITSNKGYNWRAAIQETVSATLNRTVSSGISGASYYTGTFSTVNRSPDGRYVAVSSRGNFYLTWEPGQAYWQPHNRAVARRIQSMGWRADGGLWLLVRGGGLYLSKGTGFKKMVIFRQHISPSTKLECLVVETEYGVEQTRFLTQTPLAGRYACLWPSLRNPLHMTNWTSVQTRYSNKLLKFWSLQAPDHHDANIATSLPSLYRRIIQGKIRWGDSMIVEGEYRHIPSYWEWTGDVLIGVKKPWIFYEHSVKLGAPKKNTLLTSIGELSVSLWDLHVLGGLPILDSFYEEVVPEVKELIGFDEKKIKYLHRTCEYLFAAFHHLRGANQRISFSQWIKFWFKKPLRYGPAPPRPEEKSSRLELTQNPSGALPDTEMVTC